MLFGHMLLAHMCILTALYSDVAVVQSGLPWGGWCLKDIVHLKLKFYYYPLTLVLFKTYI